MKNLLGLTASAIVLAACASDVPDSNPRGVGFNDFDSYSAQQRNAELTGAPLPPERAIAQDTIAVLNATGSELGTPPVEDGPITPLAPVEQTQIASASPSVVTTAPVTPNNPTISDEQDFSAVSSRESIQSDAERLEQQRAAYEVIQPGALPTRSGDSGPNVVAFALATSNRVGESIYSRSGGSSPARLQRLCLDFPSQDRAQEAFLAAGGPERDRRGLDPDGDGFACYWDPSPYRSARGSN